MLGNTAALGVFDAPNCIEKVEATNQRNNHASGRSAVAGTVEALGGSLWGHLAPEKSALRNHEKSVHSVPPLDETLQDHRGKPNVQTKHSSWKPVDQPMWRQGNDSIWEKHQISGHQSIDLPLKPQKNIDNVCVEDQNVQQKPGIPDICSKPHAEVEKPQCIPEQAHIAENWYESSDESIDIYEDWYYEERELLNEGLVANLTNCSTTTGGIQVCRNAAEHWVYPSHIPERKYQLHAISRALFSNTLVCYPTGLGKTLIAAVVMHNFVRWFPRSKVVFIAPTKPLVSQQMKACQNFMGLDVSSACEMTGRAKGDERKAAWHNVNILAYFCTPQTFWNDVKRGICPYEIISCVVVDECHRATGQADVVQALKYMRTAKSKFRVLGLSATPGSSREQVQEVIDSLGINKVVFKDENDKDVAPYVHNKESEVFVVSPEYSGNAARSMLMASLQRIVGDLSCHGKYYGVADAERVTRYGMQQARKCYKGGSWSVVQQFTQASILSDVRDQLDGYGPKAALAFLQIKMVEDTSLKALYSNDPQFSHFICSLEKSVSQGGCNPKIQKLKEILRKYFESHSNSKSGRAIIFATLRDGVASIIDSLESMKPSIRARGFIGQGGGGQKGKAGMKQSEQKKVLSEFTSGECNLLVATCIGEEGLDIPNVDLIICFDAISSPTRALQRQGRTGRHSDGKIIYLLTAGQEEERFNKSSQAMNKLHSQLKDAESYFTLNSNVVRMLPREFNPKLAHVVLGSEGKSREKQESLIENIPLALQLEEMKKEKARKSPVVENQSVDVRIGKIASMPSGDSIMNVSRKRRQNFLLHSQSPRIQNKEVSPLSTEDLSLIERIGRTPVTHREGGTPKFTRICKAKNENPPPEIINAKGKTVHHNKEREKKQSKFIDDEACLSGSDIDDDPDDPDAENHDLEGFIHDGTPEMNGSQLSPYLVANKKLQSPSVSQMMCIIRSRRKGVLISQSESLRNTPNEYDVDDSFINDHSIDYESSGEIVQ